MGAASSKLTPGADITIQKQLYPWLVNSIHNWRKKHFLVHLIIPNIPCQQSTCIDYCLVIATIYGKVLKFRCFIMCTASIQYLCQRVHPSSIFLSAYKVNEVRLVWWWVLIQVILTLYADKKTLTPKLAKKVPEFWEALHISEELFLPAWALKFPMSNFLKCNLTWVLCCCDSQCECG